MARTMPALPWPRFWQAIPPAKSTYSCPSASQTRAPHARVTTRSVVEIAKRAGIPPAEVLRFDGNTPPDPPPTARPETIAEALERIQSYLHGGFPELLRAIADYNAVEPENVVLGAGADDLLMLCAR